METFEVRGDRLEVLVDGDINTPSRLFLRFVRIAQQCQEHGVRKILYVCTSRPSAPWVVTELLHALPGMGLGGHCVGLVLPNNEATYPFLFIEGIASKVGVQVGVFPSRGDAEEFLSGDRCTAVDERKLGEDVMAA